MRCSGRTPWALQNTPNRAQTRVSFSLGVEKHHSIHHRPGPCWGVHEPLGYLQQYEWHAPGCHRIRITSMTRTPAREAKVRSACTATASGTLSHKMSGHTYGERERESVSGE
jgi:hypothetical protein